jgi:hypothetical protein
MGEEQVEGSGERLPVSELLGVYQGANSPFGDDVAFPLPLHALRYEHPEPQPEVPPAH